MSSFSVGPLTVALHRTVRVAEGRAPAALPPSLGSMELHKVSDYRASCPPDWEDDAAFVCLHPKEALWLSFRPHHGGPVAILCGAGGLTGEKLSLELAQGNYMVAPPQPWIDGWKDKGSGTVYQFVATEYKHGEGATVAEQLIGAESKSGGIGLAVFEPVDRAAIKAEAMVGQGMLPTTNCGYSEAMSFGGLESLSCGGDVTRSAKFIEHGVGKGGAIIQKIYPDPHGLAAWKSAPVAVRAIYLVSAEGYAEITGKPAPPSPVASDAYAGPYFETHDQHKADVAGSAKFTGLKSVFHQDAEKAVPKPS
jgi:hypothetical protein